jgi:uncharacterized membrane protein
MAGWIALGMVAAIYIVGAYALALAWPMIRMQRQANKAMQAYTAQATPPLVRMQSPPVDEKGSGE